MRSEFRNTTVKWNVGALLIVCTKRFRARGGVVLIKIYICLFLSDLDRAQSGKAKSNLINYQVDKWHNAQIDKWYNESSKWIWIEVKSRKKY